MAGTKPPKCPLCRNPASEKWAPFCSPGCKDRDLLQWLGEGYKIPGPAVSPDQIADHFAGDSGCDGED